MHPPFDVAGLATVLPPEGCSDLSLSPHGDRIAWLNDYADHSRTTELLRRMSRILHIPRTEPDSGLWISDTKGRNLRLIAIWTRGTKTDTNLQWTPDGKHISFDQIDANPASKGPLAGVILGPSSQWKRHTVFEVDVP